MNYIGSRILFSVFLNLSMPAVFGSEAKLTLNRFLEQVQTSNSSLVGSTQKRSGFQDQALQGKHLFAPNLVATAQTLTDQRITTNPLILGNKTVSNTYAIGLSQITPFGLQGKLSYNVNYVSITGASPTFISDPAFYTGQPMVEITQSLWANGFGSAIRANRDLAEATSQANMYNEKYISRLILVSAEIAYWKLAEARQVVHLQKANLKTAKEFRDWTARRVKLHLQDRSDLLQAESAMQLHTLELESAIQEEQAASRDFNRAREVESIDVPEELQPPELALAAEVLSKMETRDDVKSLEQLTRATIANASLQREQTLPVFDVMASYSLNARNNSSGTMFSGSIKSDHPMWMVGLKFSAPLDFGTTASIRESSEKLKAGAEVAFVRKHFEELEDWKDLNIKITDAKKRLSMVRALEAAQKEKWNYEQKRFAQGRSTTYQVLIFEQDYSQSRLNRIRTELEVLTLTAQMKIYGASI